ncbi:hypothetical protein ACEPAH_2199 [Sanghuangporus vaninii]
MSRLVSLTILALVSSARGLSTGRRADSAVKACQLLQSSFPQLVSFPGSEQYEADIEHWGITSTQNSTCSIEPQTADDVSKIIKIIGRSDIMAPFAVKSGGHAHNLGHSSTPGVQISMSRFNQLSYDDNRGTVTIGVGLTWDEVYSQLEPLGVMVVGGRVPGVGVGGLSLGGGYSWKTDQYGLTIDTIVSHNIVLPSGQQVVTSNSSYSDLFFGLKGGLNNFGIVTNITYEAHPQTLVYGGSILYSPDETDAVNAAISDFSLNNTDPKAQIANIYTSAAGQFSTTVILFYDAPTLPSGVYDAFFSIPNLYSDIKARTYADFVVTTGTYDFGFEPFGEANHVVPITKYTVAVLDKMAEETIAAGSKLTSASNGSIVAINMIPEPFINPNFRNKGGAYPHPSSRPVTPASPTFVYQMNSNWTADDQSAFHDLVVSTMKDFCNEVQTVAVSEGVSRWDDILYSNYALGDTSLDLLFGSNLSQLKKIAKKYDPNGFMKLTGGFHF